MKETTIKKIIEFFNDNEDLYNSCIEELDNYNGYLTDDRYYEMDMINDFYNSTDAIELLQRAYYGYDEDSYITDAYGQKHHDSFNPNRDFFKFNGYGNLVSADYKDYSHLLDKYLIEELSENREDIDTIEENEDLKTLFDELEEE